MVMAFCCGYVGTFLGSVWPSDALLIPGAFWCWYALHHELVFPSLSMYTCMGSGWCVGDGKESAEVAGGVGGRGCAAAGSRLVQLVH
jgi:hypothetical protein